MMLIKATHGSVGGKKRLKHFVERQTMRATDLPCFVVVVVVMHSIVLFCEILYICAWNAHSSLSLRAGAAAAATFQNFNNVSKMLFLLSSIATVPKTMCDGKKHVHQKRGKSLAHYYYCYYLVLLLLLPNNVSKNPVADKTISFVALRCVSVWCCCCCCCCYFYTISIVCSTIWGTCVCMCVCVNDKGSSLIAMAREGHHHAP